jgi:drug/metabolite transporter (DMT)-like permease
MKRGAIIFAVVALLAIGDGWYLIATNNNVGGDTGTLFGHFLSAGQETVIAGCALMVAAGIMWAVALLRGRASGSRSQAEPPAKVAATAEASVSQAQTGKGQGDQPQS